MPARVPSRVARVAALGAPDDGRPAQLGIVAAGTADGAAVVDAVVDRLRAQNVAVVRLSGRRLEGDQGFGAVRDLLDGADGADGADGNDVRAYRDLVTGRLDGAALVVDEAQWLDPGSLRVVVGVAERAADRGQRLVVAHRPAPGQSDLAALDAVLGRTQPLVALGPLDEPEVGELAAIILGAAVDDQLVDVVHDQTDGMPALVRLLLAEWVSAGAIAAGRLTAPARRWSRRSGRRSTSSRPRPAPCSPPSAPARTSTTSWSARSPRSRPTGWATPSTPSTPPGSSRPARATPCPSSPPPWPR